MTESEIILEKHLNSARFQAGAVRGRWKFIKLQWPNLFIEITSGTSHGVVLRMECTGYPQQAPTAMPWDLDANDILDFRRWPTGGRISHVFRPDWKNGTALYLPCDRVSIEGHHNWRNEYPSLIWEPGRGIVQYIEIIYELLQSNNYVSETS